MNKLLIFIAAISFNASAFVDISDKSHDYRLHCKSFNSNDGFMVKEDLNVISYSDLTQSDDYPNGSNQNMFLAKKEIQSFDGNTVINYAGSKEIDGGSLMLQAYIMPVEVEGQKHYMGSVTAVFTENSTGFQLINAAKKFEVGCNAEKVELK